MRSSRVRALVTAALLWVPAWASAQDQPGRTELGFVPFGVTVSVVEDETLTVIGVPAGSFFTTVSRGLYLQHFATDHVAIEPQIGATAWFGGGENLRMLSGVLRMNYLFRGADAPSGYVFGGGGVMHLGFDDEGDTNPTLNAGVGYRQPIRSAGSVRVELGFERMFDDGGGTNSFNLAVGVALRF